MAETTRPSKRVREAVFARDGMICHFCGKACRPWTNKYDLEDVATVNLLTPRDQGGSFAMNNLVTACWQCSTSKGAKNRIEFRDWRSEVFDSEETRL